MRLEGTILVTGGAGFIGSRVVSRLAARGLRVRCLLRPSTRTGRIDSLPVGRVEGDVRDAAAVARAADGCSGIIHLASPSSWAVIGARDVPEAVLGGARNVFQAALQAGNIPVVFVSSAAAIGCTTGPRPLTETDQTPLPPRMAYAAAKRRAEEMGREFHRRGLPLVTVNPVETFGPDDTGLVTAGNLADLIRQRICAVPRGGTGVVHAEDVAAGIIAACEKGRPGERYILCGGNVEYAALARMARAAAGRDGQVHVIPQPLIDAAAFLQRRLRIPLGLNLNAVDYARGYWYMDASKAGRELGIVFRGVRETVTETVDWLGTAGHI